jgi:hypothetical protein
MRLATPCGEPPLQSRAAIHGGSWSKARRPAMAGGGRWEVIPIFYFAANQANPATIHNLFTFFLHRVNILSKSSALLIIVWDVAKIG